VFCLGLLDKFGNPGAETLDDKDLQVGLVLSMFRLKMLKHPSFRSSIYGSLAAQPGIFRVRRSGHAEGIIEHAANTLPMLRLE
jgi:hypothetical protein